MEEINGFALANTDKEGSKLKKTRVFSDKLGITGDYAGEKIKDIADNAGFIGAILALFFGFLIWYKADDLMGFLIGLVVSGAGIYASYILASMLYSYADMVRMNMEQMKSLKALEAKKAEELELAIVRQNKEQNTVEAITADGMRQESNNADDVLIWELTEPREKTTEVKTKVVMVGTIDSRTQIAHFDGRHDLELICPFCNRTQLAEGDGCVYCGCKFIYDDEQRPDNDISPEIA